MSEKITEVMIEAAAKAMCVAKGVGPDVLCQIHVWDGTEHFDHEDERGLRYIWGWRKQVKFVLPALSAALNAAEAQKPVDETFQQEVDRWLLACFGKEIARDRVERNHRFIEEALELVQAGGCTASEAHQLVDYVFDRPVGDMWQEVGGVMNTLAALCLAYDLDMVECGNREIARCWTKVEKIRAKQAAKPKHSPLPEHISARPSPSSAGAGAVDKLRHECAASGYHEHDGCTCSDDELSARATPAAGAVEARSALSREVEQ